MFYVFFSDSSSILKEKCQYHGIFFKNICYFRPLSIHCTSHYSGCFVCKDRGPTGNMLDCALFQPNVYYLSLSPSCHLLWICHHLLLYLSIWVSFLMWLAHKSSSTQVADREWGPNVNCSMPTNDFIVTDSLRLLPFTQPVQRSMFKMHFESCW